MENGKVPFPLVCSGSGSGANAFTRSEQERKRRVRPWTEECQCKLFLLGLKKYGANILRNFVQTRTPTEVACHAQYFIRLNSGGKDKKRSSIRDRDITTDNLTDDQPPSLSQSSLITDQFSTLAMAPDVNQNGRANSSSN